MCTPFVMGQHGWTCPEQTAQRHAALTAWARLFDPEDDEPSSAAQQPRRLGEAAGASDAATPGHPPTGLSATPSVA